MIVHLLQALACLLEKKKSPHWQKTNIQEHLQRGCYSLLHSNPWIKVINSTQRHIAMTLKVQFWLAGYIKCKPLTSISRVVFFQIFKRGEELRKPRREMPSTISWHCTK